MPSRPSHRDPDPPVTVRTFPYAWAAELARARLEQAGIEAWVDESVLDNPYKPTVGGMGDVAVYVGGSRLADARAVLEEGEDLLAAEKPEELDESYRPVGPAPRSLLRRAVIVLAAVIAAAFLVSLVGPILPVTGNRGGGRADTGRLREVLYSFGSEFGPMADFTEVTSDWELDSWRHTGSLQMSGGAAIDDLDRDGRADVVVGGGGIEIFFGDGAGFGSVDATDVLFGEDVTGVGLTDVDLDGWPDVLVAGATGDDSIIWGGEWTQDRKPEDAEVDRLPGAAPTASWLAGDVTGDGAVDLVRLGYGSDDSPADDLVLVATSFRAFDPQTLPDSDRLSLAGELVDLTGDGVAEIWVTRDTGWRTGGDSVYSFETAAEAWGDIAPELGADLEIDGMGVTVADLNGDDRLDSYLSDIGENDVLAGGRGRFTPVGHTGAGRIRPPGDAFDVVSSSWASGAADFNLDGQLDLFVVNGGFEGRDVANKIDGTEVKEIDSPALFLGDGRGRFTDVWPALGTAAEGRYRGAAVGDLDADGDADLVLVSHGEGVRVFRNDSKARSLTLAPGPGCSARGATVRVEAGRGGAPVTAVFGPHGFLGSHAQELIVGTSKARTARVHVTWPGGAEETRRVRLDRDRTRMVLDDCAVPK